MLTKVQIKSILILLDNEGHAEWEIAQFLGMEDSNLNPKLKKLKDQGIIYQGEARISSNEKKKKEGDYKEFPYFLSNKLDGLKRMIEEIAKLKRVFEAFFILEIIENSRYIESMVKLFGEDVNKAVNLVLNEYYPAYSDEFFNNNVRKHLLRDLWDCIPITRANMLCISEDELEIKFHIDESKPTVSRQLEYLEMLNRNKDKDFIIQLMDNTYIRQQFKNMDEYKFFYR